MLKCSFTQHKCLYYISLSIPSANKSLHAYPHLHIGLCHLIPIILLLTKHFKTRNNIAKVRQTFCCCCLMQTNPTPEHIFAFKEVCFHTQLKLQMQQFIFYSWYFFPLLKRITLIWEQQHSKWTDKVCPN